jgi:hypothetical protein
MSLWKKMQMHGHIAGDQLPFPQVNIINFTSEIWNLMAPSFGFGNRKVLPGLNSLAGLCNMTDSTLEIC